MMDSSRPGNTAGSSVASFAALGLDDALCLMLQQRGYQQPTAVQQQAIPAALAGRDLTVAASTGSGKTAAFVLPLLQQLMVAFRQGVTVGSNRVRVLIVVPTRELAEQVATSVLHYREGLPLRSYAVYGGLSINPQMMALRKGPSISCRHWCWMKRIGCWIWVLPMSWTTCCVPCRANVRRCCFQRPFLTVSAP